MNVKFISSCLILLLYCSVYSQFPGFNWGISFGGPDFDICKDIVTDSIGNLYLIGNFKSTKINIANNFLYNSTPGSFDFIIIKMSHDGNIIWAKSFGGNQDDYVTSASIDLQGNLYLTGYFNSEILNLDGNPLKNFGTENSSVFITKVNPDGNVIRAMNFLGKSNDIPTSISCFDEGKCIYLCGNFQSDTLSVSSLKVHKKGDIDIFVAKFDTSLNIVWLKSFGSEKIDYASNMNIDKEGNIYIVGYFNSDSILFQNFVLKNSGNYDGYVLKLDTEGIPLWCKSLRGTENEKITQISVSSSGTIYICGEFGSTKVFIDSVEMANSMYFFTNLFVTKLDKYGKIIWCKVFGGNGNREFEENLYLDYEENPILTGSFSSSSISFDFYNFKKVGCSSLFLVKLNKYGEIDWSFSTGGDGNDVGIKVVSDKHKNLYFAGCSNSTYLNLGGISLNKFGSQDFFIAQIKNDKLTIISEQEKNVVSETSILDILQPTNSNNIQKVEALDILGRKIDILYDGKYSLKILNNQKMLFCIVFYRDGSRNKYKILLEQN